LGIKPNVVATVCGAKIKIQMMLLLLCLAVLWYTETVN